MQSAFLSQIVLLGVFILQSVTGSGFAQDAVGVTALAADQILPRFGQQGRILQVSSYDRSGGNSDGGSNEPGITSYLYRENGHYVLLDEEGPGCVYRIWFTFFPECNIRFYFDGESVPRIDMGLRDFFSGTRAPFLAPLAGDERASSGGFYCYVPIPFEKSLKIVLTDFPLYYNITYQKFPPGSAVSSFTGGEDLSGARQLFENAGQLLYHNAALTAISETFTLSGGETHSINIPAPGTIHALEVQGLVALSPEAFITWCDNLWLHITFDGHTTADVSAPFTAFFGGAIGDVACRSLFVGASRETRRFYCYFPMPFRSSARLSLQSRGGNAGTIAVKVAYLPGPVDGLGEDFGYFRATYRSQDAVMGEDVLLLETAGRGTVVGCVLDMTKGGTTKPRYLEGDERIYIDGSATPQIYGTGTEDFVNGGNYFSNGPFSQALHGQPFGLPREEDRVTCYRFFLGDRIDFYRHLRFGLEHGDFNNIPAWYRTLLFWYGGAAAELLPCDSLDVGKTALEQAHAWRSGSEAVTTRSAYYEGDADHITIVDDGRVLRTPAEVTLQIPAANDGIRLRRRLDYALAGQKADVYLQDSKVGTWYDAGENDAKSWRDSEFELPAALTRGLSTLRLRFDPAPYAGGWSVFRLWAFYYPGAALQPTAAALLARSTQPLSGVAGDTLLPPVRVAVLDHEGHPVAGHAVHYRILSGGGVLAASAESTAVVYSDAAGEAAVGWISGPRAGVTQQLEVNATGPAGLLQNAPLKFNATAASAPAWRIAALGALQRSDWSGQMLEDSVAVRISDRYDNPVSGYPLWFRLYRTTSADRCLDSLRAVTDQDGKAHTRFRLGYEAGDEAYVVRAEAPGLTGSPVVFIISARDQQPPQPPRNVRVFTRPTLYPINREDE